ncbi:N,N-dimethylformamidase beta subunit family domain-containing protein [Solirubrobacter soli]|uniref:N,N-dimethylformamidase beta subunit family domain-containing protein n=1 Tax=Solirubrobacter soli TaxID=363832 RepID=UPI000489B187|nr:N,N-dimethylformamidase beta subunit family domain-containing protein [Solirubrobacter soli]
MRRLLVTLVAFFAVAITAPAVAAAAPPTGVTGMALDGRVEISWQPVAGATGYKVYRGATATTVTTPLMGSPMTPVDPLAPASFTDIGPANGTTYYYAVRAIVSGVESANSRVVQATPKAATCTGANVVVRENCLPGNTGWEVGYGGQPNIYAYATASSIDHGGSVDIKVSAPGTSSVDMFIYRSGYYGGTGARLFAMIPSVPVSSQPGCTSDTNMGLYDCSAWHVDQTITTSANWPSGVYLIRVARNDTHEDTHALVVVRDDERHSDVLYGVPDTTYQAYNSYGGKSLYPHNSTSVTTVTGTGRAAKVSFDRPYNNQHDGVGKDWYTFSDYASVSWLERMGYDISYEAVSNLEVAGSEVRDHRVFISGAHDEYYSAAMRTALEQARDAGTRLFFTGANEVYWKVRFEPSIVSGAARRTLVSYKTAQSGPADPSGISTSTWRDPAGPNKPENSLTGGMYVGQEAYTYFPLKVTSAQGKDRIWRYTGLDTQANGATATVGTSLIGHEWDARVSNGLEPPGIVTLSASPASGDILQDNGGVWARGSTNSNMSKYTAASGALVVSTGTNHWNWGLGINNRNEGEPNAKIQQATTNILVDMGVYPETPMSGMVLDDPTMPPLVTQKLPAPNVTGVDIGTTVKAVFSRPMNGATITSGSFTLTGPGTTSVPATVSYDGVSLTATLTPSSPLALNTTYTATLSTAVAAANGIALGAPVTWSFTTRPPDTTKPSVAMTAPADGATLLGSANLTAAASDDTAVAGVQFKLDGDNLGSEDTSAPYAYTWALAGVPAGPHTLTAVARDTSGNTQTSAPVNVTVDPTGLVAAYGFEEATGTTVTDSSGKGNTGTLVNGPVRATTGKFGKTITFDGSNDYVNVPDANSLDLTNALTMEAWVNLATAGGAAWRTVLMKEQSGGLAYGMYANTDNNRPSGHVYTSSEVDTRGTAQVAANTWTHLATTYDGTTLRYYVNGVQTSSKAVTGNIVNSTSALRIGGNSVWGEYLSGRIDEVRIYRRVLSAAEITTDMNTPVVPSDSVPPSAPGTPTATGSLAKVALSWTAATDNVGVDHYNVYRSTTSGFTPAVGNRIATPAGLSYNDTPLAAGTYYYRVSAVDAVGNEGPFSPQVQGDALADSTPPTTPGSPAAAGALGKVTVSWTASTDNVGVDHYNVYRSITDGFTPAAGNRIGSPTGLSLVDQPLAAGQYFYRVTAVDAIGNESAPTAQFSGTATADTTAPTVSLTAPAAGTVSGSVTVTATASDNVGVAGVTLKVDGAALGTELTASPYTRAWDTFTVANGSHTLTATARDAAGNSTTSAPVVVTVNNLPPDTSGLVGAYGFEEASGTTATDSSSAGNTGTMNAGVTRAAGAGKFGSALTFNGTSGMISIPDANSLDFTTAMTIEAWVNPTTAGGSAWRTAVLKEQPGALVYALYANMDASRPSFHGFTSSEFDTRGTAAVPANTWTHLAGVFDGLTLRLFVNGVQVSSTAMTGSLTTSTGALRIGGNSIWPEWFAGKIDEVRLYNRALSAGEIQTDMNRAVVGS